MWWREDELWMVCTGVELCADEPRVAGGTASEADTLEDIYQQRLSDVIRIWNLDVHRTGPTQPLEQGQTTPKQGWPRARGRKTLPFCSLTRLELPL